MEGLKPGRMVYFVFDARTAAQVEDRRQRTREYYGGFVGNVVQAGDVVPAMVVAVSGRGEHLCNLKLMLDGYDGEWVTAVAFDAEKRPGTWHWMFEGQQTRYRPDRTEVAERPLHASDIPL